MRPRSSKRRCESGRGGTRPAEMHLASCDGVPGEFARYEDAVRHAVVFSAVILAVAMIRRRRVVRSLSLGA